MYQVEIINIKAMFVKLKFCAAFVLLMQVMPVLTQDCEPGNKTRPSTITRDLVIAIDESGSISSEDFQIMLNFTQTLVARFPDVGGINGTHVGVLTFSDEAKIHFNLTTYNNLIAVIEAIGNITNSGGITNTHLALNTMEEMLKGGRPGARKIAVLLTDGKATDPAAATAAANELRASGIDLVAVVGIGATVNDTVLKKIASRADLYFKAPTFASLEGIVEKIFGSICEPPDKKVCNRCEYENGIYLFADLKDCSKYKQCIAAGQVLVPSRPCPFGQFWDNTAITCRPAGAVNCDKDPCISGVLPNYAYDSICSAYWVCKDKRTVGAECCNPGFAYLHGTGCVPNATCTDECPPEDETDRRCYELKPHPTDSTKYLQHLGGGAWKTMDCAAGTEYNKTDCRCSIYGKFSPPPGCEDIVYISFDKNVQDVKYRVWVRNPKPKVKAGQNFPPIGFKGKGAGKFSGKSALYIPRFTHSFFGNQLVIRTRFLETTRTVPLPPGQLEPIFGNGDCGKDGSITVKYNRTSNEVIAKLVTLGVGGNEVTTTVTVVPVAVNPKWKDVEFRYDGTTLTLTVGSNPSVSKAASASGNIAQRRAALQIGSGCNSDVKFEGYEDEFYVFPCLPP